MPRLAQALNHVVRKWGGTPSCGRLPIGLVVLAVTGGAIANAQTAPELQQILQRLDRIESQNRELMTEVQALRQQLEAAKAPKPETEPETQPANAAPIADRVDVL